MNESTTNNNWWLDKDSRYEREGKLYKLRKAKKLYPGDLIRFPYDNQIAGDARVTAITETELEYFENGGITRILFDDYPYGTIYKYIKA